MAHVPPCSTVLSLKPSNPTQTTCDSSEVPRQLGYGSCHGPGDFGKQRAVSGVGVPRSPPSLGSGVPFGKRPAKLCWQRDDLLSGDRSGAAAQHELLDFAGRRLWQRLNRVPDLRDLEMGHAFADERSQFLVRCRHPGAENDESMWRLAPALVRHADNRYLED